MVNTNSCLDVHILEFGIGHLFFSPLTAPALPSPATQAIIFSSLPSRLRPSFTGDTGHGRPSSQPLLPPNRASPPQPAAITESRATAARLRRKVRGAGVRSHCLVPDLQPLAARASRRTPPHRCHGLPRLVRIRPHVKGTGRRLLLLVTPATPTLLLLNLVWRSTRDRPSPPEPPHPLGWSSVLERER